MLPKTAKALKKNKSKLSWSREKKENEKGRELINSSRNKMERNPRSLHSCPKGLEMFLKHIHLTTSSVLTL